MGGCSKLEMPKQGQNFQNHKITCKDSIYSEQWKLNENKYKT